MSSTFGCWAAILLLISLRAATGFRVQGVAAKGRVKCNGRPLVDALVQIYDRDRFPFDSDELLDEEYTDEIGAFFVDGTTRELTDIEPELRITHNCSAGEPPCRRYLVVPISGAYIHYGDAEVVYNFGTQDLAVNGGELHCHAGRILKV